LHANLWDAIEPIRTLIHDGGPVDATRLADPTIPLDRVVRQRATALTAGSIQ
jgi:hypothetical protein